MRIAPLVPLEIASGLLALLFFVDGTSVFIYVFVNTFKKKRGGGGEVVIYSAVWICYYISTVTRTTEMLRVDVR